MESAGVETRPTAKQTTPECCAGVADDWLLPFPVPVEYELVDGRELERYFQTLKPGCRLAARFLDKEGNLRQYVGVFIGYEPTPRVAYFSRDGTWATEVTCLPAYDAYAASRSSMRIIRVHRTRKLQLTNRDGRLLRRAPAP